MDADFWLQRWREGRTGFHRSEVMPLLQKHWPALHVPRGTRVLVPLCGKSLDMLWLTEQRCRVLGVELSPLAVTQFFDENHLRPRTRAAADGQHFIVDDLISGGREDLEIIRGDIFGVDVANLATCGAIYDRAALIALPPPMRARYAREVYGALPAGCRGLLITLEYPHHEMQGPPFSVEEREVRLLFGERWDIALLERRDILADQPTFSEQGVTALSTAIYRLCRLTP